MQKDTHLTGLSECIRPNKKIKNLSISDSDSTISDDCELFGDISDDETISDESFDYHFGGSSHTFVNDSLKNQVNTLRKELKDVHSAYISGIKMRDSEINDLHIHLEEKFEETKELHNHNHKLWEHIQDLNKKNQTIKEEKEGWIGRTLKFEYLLNK